MLNVERIKFLLHLLSEKSDVRQNKLNTFKIIFMDGDF